jgi:hypothetical protein
MKLYGLLGARLCGRFGGTAPRRTCQYGHNSHSVTVTPDPPVERTLRGAAGWAVTGRRVGGTVIDVAHIDLGNGMPGIWVQGSTDQEIHQTALIAAACCMFNRYAGGRATSAPDDPAQSAMSANT